MKKIQKLITASPLRQLAESKLYADLVSACNFVQIEENLYKCEVGYDNYWAWVRPNEQLKDARVAPILY